MKSGRGRAAPAGTSQARRAPQPSTISPGRRAQATSGSTVMARFRSALAMRLRNVAGYAAPTGAPPETSVTATCGKRWRTAMASSIPVAPAPITARLRRRSGANAVTRGHSAPNASIGRTNKPCSRAPGMARSMRSRSCRGPVSSDSQSYPGYCHRRVAAIVPARPPARRGRGSNAPQHGAAAARVPRRTRPARSRRPRNPAPWPRRTGAPGEPRA